MVSVPRDALIRKIRSGELARVVASHSPLSALLAQEAGFDAVFLSGFEISALNGLPDMSFTTMTQHLDILRAIVHRTAIPVIADMDTGYGNAVNVIYATKLYEDAGASAIMLEDKTFPKVTSLVADGRQELLRKEEFQGKIEAAASARASADLLIIARTEALIAGAGEEEALERGLAYEEAGADLVMVHSKQRSPAEIVSFVRSWKGKVPLVIVPTAYPELDEGQIVALGKIGMVIYANQAIRAAARAMRSVFRTIREDGGIHRLGDDLLSVEDVFALQNMDQTKRQERTFLR